MAGNSIMNTFGNMMSGMPMGGQVQQMMQAFNQFKQMMNITPKQAEEKVMGMLNAGQINNNQLNQAKQMARQMADMFGEKF